MSWWATGISVGSSLLSSASQGEDESWKAEAEAAGKKEAGLKANRARALELLPAQARQEAESAQAAKTEVAQDQVAAKASAAVQAAAAGTAGISVDQTMQQLDTSAAMVSETIERQKTAAMLQLDQDAEDIIWDAEMQRYDVTVRNTGGASAGKRAVAAGLAGAATYLANR